MLRQQYIDMSKNSIPARSEFINEGGSTYFDLSEGACRCGHHSYHLWSIMDKLDEVREAFGYPMSPNSGYRCPIHNANEGGAKKSRHMYGDAADIRVKDFNKDGVINRDDWDMLSTAARSQNPGYIEPYGLTGKWVHMDWGPVR